MRAAAMLAGLAAVALTAAPSPVGAQAKDWTKSVVATPEGGFRMGNPAAKVKVIEYASMTCPHCAHFMETGAGPLKERVRTGKVSYELRNFVLNGIDVTATLLARCAGPANFFPLTERLFATQPQWVAKISNFSSAEKTKIQAMDQAAQLNRIATLSGLTQAAQQFGVTPQKAQQCLSDKAALERLGAMYEAGAKMGVTGTPTFFVNGVKTQAHEWPELAPAIIRAGG